MMQPLHQCRSLVLAAAEVEFWQRHALLNLTYDGIWTLLSA